MHIWRKGDLFDQSEEEEENFFLSPLEVLFFARRNHQRGQRSDGLERVINGGGAPLLRGLHVHVLPQPPPPAAGAGAASSSIL